jgi:endonuclease YncB( thermonuclease family)
MKRALALTLAVAAGSASAGIIEGRVIEVVDGATITVLSSAGASLHRVRLAGIDAPRKGRDQEGTSRASLRRLASGKTVRVETGAINSKGLLVGAVLIVPDPKECGKDACAPFVDPGLTQLGNGLAVIDKSNLDMHRSGTQARYLTAQAQAKANRVGVWRDPHFQLRADQQPR